MLKRENNHNCVILTGLQKGLKPIEEADEVNRNFTKNKKKVGGNDPCNHHNKRQRNNDRQIAQ